MVQQTLLPEWVYWNVRRNQEKERAERLKQSAKELLDGIGTDTEEEQRIVALIYGCVRSGFRECHAGKGGAK